MTGRSSWQHYEAQVAARLRARADRAMDIVLDARLPGRRSGRMRQIDVLVRHPFGILLDAEPVTMIVDCKRWVRPVTVREVESLAALADDVGAQFGLLVTTVGFSQAARERAQQFGHIYLDIVPFDELGDWSPSLAPDPLKGSTLMIDFMMNTRWGAIGGRDIDRSVRMAAESVTDRGGQVMLVMGDGILGVFQPSDADLVTTGTLAAVEAARTVVRITPQLMFDPADLGVRAVVEAGELLPSRRDGPAQYIIGQQWRRSRELMRHVTPGDVLVGPRAFEALSAPIPAEPLVSHGTQRLTPPIAFRLSA